MKGVVMSQQDEKKRHNYNAIKIENDPTRYVWCIVVGKDAVVKKVAVLETK